MFPLEGEGPLGPLLPAHISELVVGVILFFLILIVIKKVVSPRMEKMYAERADAIRGGMERADQAQAAAEEARKAYLDKLASAHDDAQKIRDEARAAGTKIAADMRDRATEEADRIVSSAHAQVEAEKSHVMAELTKDVGTMATTLAGKIVGQTLEDDAQVKRTVDEFIASLEKETV